jgi:predicted NAD/FAD-binding protein
MAAETPVSDDSNVILERIIENSIFTRKQISITSKRLSGPGKHKSMTSGSYYRQVGQCRDKTIAVLYSIVLLELIGAVDDETATALAKITAQLRVIFDSENRDVVLQARTEDVMSVIFQVIQRVCKL